MSRAAAPSREEINQRAPGGQTRAALSAIKVDDDA